MRQAVRYKAMRTGQCGIHGWKKCISWDMQTIFGFSVEQGNRQTGRWLRSRNGWKNACALMFHRRKRELLTSDGAILNFSDSKSDYAKRGKRTSFNRTCAIKHTKRLKPAWLNKSEISNFPEKDVEKPGKHGCSPPWLWESRITTS